MPVLSSAPLSASQLQAQAALAVVLAVVVRLLIAICVQVRKRDLSDETKKGLAAAVCAVGTLALALRQGAFAQSDATTLVGVLAIQITIASNVYDKIIHPLEKTLRGGQTPEAPTQAPANGGQ